MKILQKTMLVCLAFVISLSLFVGCNQAHTHDFQYVIIEQATCLGNGEMEGICKECGEKIYQEIVGTHNYAWTVIKQSTCTEKGETKGVCIYCTEEKISEIREKGHDYQAGVCTRCERKETAVYLSNDQKLGLSIEEIFEKAKAGNILSQNVDEFLRDLGSTNLQSVLVKNQVMFWNFVYGGIEFSFTIDQIKEDFPMVEGNQDKILTINYNYNSAQLIVTYYDGTSVPVGYLTAGNLELVNEIKALAVNNQNEFLIVLEDGEVVKCGTFVPTEFYTEESLLIYQKIANKQEYMVIGNVNKNAKNLVVPKTHRGLPVTQIARGAFYNNTNLKTIVIGENVTDIFACAFSGCTELSDIMFNKNLTQVGLNAFYNCPKLAIVSYYGQLSDAKNIDVLEGNEFLTNATWLYRENATE